MENQNQIKPNLLNIIVASTQEENRAFEKDAELF